MKRTIIILLAALFLNFTSSFAQDAEKRLELNVTNLVGKWSYQAPETHASEGEHLHEHVFPLKSMTFSNAGEFEIEAISNKVVGNYEVTGQTVRLFNALKDGVAQQEEESLSVLKLTSNALQLKMLDESGTTFPEFKKD